jgi:predicted DNA-binding protein
VVSLVRKWLTTRDQYSTTIDKELLKKLRELSKKTRIDQSKLLDEAIEDLLKKYGRLK